MTIRPGLLAIAFASIVFPSRAAHAILGGRLLDLSDSIAHVTVAISEPGNPSFCSGIVISQSAVLTAAHCVAGKAPTRLFVTFGADALHSALFRGVTQTYVPQQYIPYGDQLPGFRNAWDIAIVMFDGSLPKPYRIAQLVPGDALQAGDAAEIAGYGYNLPDGTGAGTLRGCETTVMDPQFSGSELQLQATAHCSPAGRDSGGPVYRAYGTTVYVYGIHIWGWHDEASNPTYSVHTRIGAFYPWIQAVLINP